MTVENVATNLGDVYIHVDPTSGYATSLIPTNRAGRTYYRSGNVYTEVKGTDNGSTLATSSNQSTGYKQSSVTFGVTITNAASAGSAPSAAALASVAGTYEVAVSCGGYVKFSLTKTTSLSKDSAVPAVNGAEPTGEAGEEATTGALGAQKATGSLKLMQVKIADDGSVTTQLYDANGDLTGSPASFTTLTTAVNTPTIYYGLEINSGDAQSYSSMSSIYEAATTSVITPAVTGGSIA